MCQWNFEHWRQLFGFTKTSQIHLFKNLLYRRKVDWEVNKQQNSFKRNCWLRASRLSFGHGNTLRLRATSAWQMKQVLIGMIKGSTKTRVLCCSLFCFYEFRTVSYSLSCGKRVIDFTQSMLVSGRPLTYHSINVEGSMNRLQAIIDFAEKNRPCVANKSPSMAKAENFIHSS